MRIETLANYLGREASTLLADEPFKLRIDYVFAQDGMDFVCDAEDKVSTIFLYSDESRSPELL